MLAHFKTLLVARQMYQIHCEDNWFKQELMSELRSASVKCPLPRLGTGWVLGVTAPPNDLPSHPLLPFHNWRWEISPLRPGTGRRRKLPGN